MSSLLDQTALADLAERLVAAARRAGAEQADAVAVRSVSLSVDVRDGAVEESQRAEGDDVGLRVLVGHKQAAVSTNDIKGDGLDALAERAVAMARVAPEDEFAGLADPALLAREFPDLDLLDPDMPTVDAPGETRAARRTSRPCGVRRVEIRRRLGLGRHRRHGARHLDRISRRSRIGSRHSISMAAIAGDGTGMEQDYDYSSTLHAADLDKAEDIGRHAGERAVARLNPRKVATRKVPVVFDPRISGSLIGHLASAANGGAIARKTSFLREKLGERIFAKGIDIVDDPRRRAASARGCSTPRASPRARSRSSTDGVLKTWILDSATARELDLKTTGHAQRGVSSVPYPSPSNLHLEPGTKTPDELIGEIKDGFYITDLIGQGVNLVTGDYSRGASGFWIENGERTFPVSEVTIAGHLSEIFAGLTPANDLVFRYGTNAPTLRVEGLTVAGH